MRRIQGWCFTIIACMVMNNSLLAEVLHAKRRRRGKRDRETPAGRWRVVSYNSRPHLWTKPTGFENQFRLTWDACALLRLNIGDFWPYRCYWPNRFCKLCHRWLKRNCCLENTNTCLIGTPIEARKRYISFLWFFSPRERPLLEGKVDMSSSFNSKHCPVSFTRPCLESEDLQI